MAETPKFEVGQKATITVDIVGGLSDASEAALVVAPWGERFFVKPKFLEPTPLLPSSDEVEKLLAALELTTEWESVIHGPQGPLVNPVGQEAAALIRSLQSQLASLRAQMPAWEVFVKNWPTHSRLGTNFVSLNGFNIAEGHYNAIRDKLTRVEEK